MLLLAPNPAVEPARPSILHAAGNRTCRHRGGLAQGVIGGRQAAGGRFAERSQFGGPAFPGWQGMGWAGGAGSGGPARTGVSAPLFQERSQFEREGLRFQRLRWADWRGVRPGVSSVPDGRVGWSVGCHSLCAGGGGRQRSRNSRRGLAHVCAFLRPSVRNPLKVQGRFSVFEKV